ncbi:MAG TPA: hypothetical protein VLY24_13050 [Bryobacteraceae bacterium]|nr:hypothetical protein [Bryobacteraceae bacterium]
MKSTRTTLTLDDDVVSLLQKEMRRSGVSFKVAVNHYLRVGLITPKQSNRKPFQVTPRPMGLPPGLSYDNVAELLDAIEAPIER